MFSRIRELFLNEVGRDVDNISLELFVKHALRHFSDRYLRSSSVVYPRNISFNGENAHLSLTVFGSNQRPDMSRCRFQGFFHGQINDVIDIIPETEIIAEFNSDVDNDNLVSFMRSYISESDKQDVTVGLLRIQHSHNRLRKLTVQPLTLDVGSHIEEGKKRDQYRHKRRIERSLSRLLFHTATKLTIARSFYDNDKGGRIIRDRDRGLLLHESCVLVKKSTNHYFLEYEIQSASEIRPLIADAMQTALKLFKMVENSFTVKMFNEMRMTSQRQEIVND